MLSPRVLFLLAAVLGAGRAAAQAPGDSGLDATKGELTSDGDELAPKLPLMAKVKEGTGYPVGEKDGFRLSFYWLGYESDYANEPYDTDIYDRNGFWLGRYPSAFVYEVRLEGTGILRDGRVINYSGSCNYGIGTCFSVLDPNEHPLGRGVQARALVPFRSVAVDPRYIPIGAPIFLPELVGLVLPDGTRHDGCLRADDQGGAIKQHKIDFFVESYNNFRFLAEQQWWRLKATPYLDEPRCEYLRLGEPRERLNEHTDWAELHQRKGAVQAMRGKTSSKRRRADAASEHRHRGTGGAKAQGTGRTRRGR